MAIADLANMPHALYAGASGSGKSVGLACLVLSLLRNRVRLVNLILIDVGARSLDCFDWISHLSCPIVKDVATATHVIQCLTVEMERRIHLCSNELNELPALVCIIDEVTALINDRANKPQAECLKAGISALLQRGRHAKIHMVLAVQNPTVENLNGIEVGNITARMAFKCAKSQNSNTILGQGGAEKLSRKGEMLFQSSYSESPLLIQGAYVSSDEIKQFAARANTIHYDLSNRFEIPAFDPSVVLIQNPQTVDEAPDDNDEDRQFARIAVWVLRYNSISTEKIKQYFRMGNHARDIMERLRDIGFISEKRGNLPSQVLIHEMGDIPENILHFLQVNNASLKEIEKALTARYHHTHSDNTLTDEEGGV